MASAQPPRDSRNQLRDPIAVLRYVNDSTIAAQSDGIITSIEAEEGNFVSAGALLISLDSRLAHADLKVAQKRIGSVARKSQ